MKKQELYKELGMDEFFYGDSFVVDRNKSCFGITEEIDKICITEKRNGLGEKWNELNFEECSELLLNAFTFDLAYQDFAVMPLEKPNFTKILSSQNLMNQRLYVLQIGFKIRGKIKI